MRPELRSNLEVETYIITPAERTVGFILIRILGLLWSASITDQILPLYSPPYPTYTPHTHHHHPVKAWFLFAPAASCTLSVPASAFQIQVPSSVEKAFKPLGIPVALTASGLVKRIQEEFPRQCSSLSLSFIWPQGQQGRFLQVSLLSCFPASRLQSSLGEWEAD